jgi:hypothetical protein
MEEAMGKHGMGRRGFIGKSGVLAVCSLAFGEPMLSSGKKNNPVKPPTDTAFTIDLADPNNAGLENTGGALKFNVRGQAKPVIVIRKSERETAVGFGGMIAGFFT